MRVPLLVAAPAVWTALELARAYLLDGFLMGALGHTQYRWISVIQLSDVTGGYGVAIDFVNDWASPANTAKSWDMVARYVIPEVNGQLAPMRESNEFVIEHREYFQRAQTAILNKINEHERAAETFRTEGVGGRAPIAAHSGPTDADADDAATG